MNHKDLITKAIDRAASLLKATTLSKQDRLILLDSIHNSLLEDLKKDYSLSLNDIAVLTYEMSNVFISYQIIINTISKYER